VSGNGVGDGGVTNRVTRAYAYEPAFGRLFRALALTPDRVARVAILTMLGAYLVPGLPPPHAAMLASVVTITLAPALVFMLLDGRLVYFAAAAGILLGAIFYASTPDRVLVYFFGMGGAAVAIFAAAHRSGRDDSFDNFDRFLSVAALALCWSTLGAWLANADRVMGQPRSFAVTSGLLFAIALAIPISAVSIVGDARRLIWLRRLSAGALPGYVLKSQLERAEEAEASALPALMGGAATDAVLVARHPLPGLAFRSGWREIAVARMPSDPTRLARRAALWLFAVAAALAAELILAVLALTPL
jgi:hypothetical protein